MAIQEIKNGEVLNVVRTKINTNFEQAELWTNRTQTISPTPSISKYPSEKAVFDYASKIHFSSSIPSSTKSGDLLLHINAPLSTEGAKGKLKINSGGTLSEFIPDRSICQNQHSASLANTVLLAGEIAYATDNKGIKVGDGATPFATLPYVGGGSGGGSDGSITYGGNNDSGYGITYQNGWIKYPNGMILQWGLSVYETTGTGSFDKVVSLPVSFNQKRIYSHAVLETETTDWNSAQVTVHPRSMGATGLRFVVKGGLVPYSGYELHWIALGF